MDVFPICRGINRYSSENWEVRIFLASPDASLNRDTAPELMHAGLYLPFGCSRKTPVIIDRHMPLFGAASDIPSNQGSGSMFLTSSFDDFDIPDLEYLRKSIFEGETPLFSPRLNASVSLFKAVMKDAFHSAAA
jgi:hypothetical protein